MKPHGLFAPFGTQPRRAWCTKPLGGGAGDIVEVGASDDDTDEQRAIATAFIGIRLARIDAAAAPGGG